MFGSNSVIVDNYHTPPILQMTVILDVLVNSNTEMGVRSLPRGLYAERASHTGTVADQRTQG